MIIKTISRQSKCLCASLFLVIVSANMIQSQFAENVAQNVETLLVGKQLTRDNNELGDTAVRIYPQRVQLKLRMNQEYRLNYQYLQAEDFPIDLYYLMGISTENNKQKFSVLAEQLSGTIKNITSNFRLGFGSFIDVPKKLESPCDACEEPYGFKNHMKLGVNATEFITTVEKALSSRNLLPPEGGLDAIMQALVCRQPIGWREEARRLLVLATDAGLHHAGDGKSSGVFTPNDAQCHIDTDGNYTHSSILNYPSISQINSKVLENAINVIFAVTPQQNSIYDEVSKHIEGSTTATLSADPTNVIELIREQYNRISARVEMRDDATSPIKVTYHSSCFRWGDSDVTSKCDGLKYGDVVNFQAEIVVTECPLNPNDWFQTFQIYPVGINESLTVDLEMLCSCKYSYELHSPKCNGHGIYKCGFCYCDESHFGRHCAFLRSTADVHSELGRDTGCRPPNTTLYDCTGRGQCVNGVCVCDKRNNPEEIISGKYCECDNYSCERVQGLLCGGPEHGTCECGSCVCKPNWTGDDCNCRASHDTCIASNGGEICSGHGECVCGACKCQQTSEGRYSGKFCEKFPTFLGRCDEFKDCVQCQMYKTGTMDADLCAKNCTLFVPRSVNVFEVNEGSGDHLCTFYDENDCRFEFMYNDSNFDDIKVSAKEQLECPQKPFSYIRNVYHKITNSFG